MTEPEAIELVGRLFTRLAGNVRDEAELRQKMAAYVEDIIDFDYEPARVAMRRLELESVFLPRPGEVRRAIFALTDPELPPPDADSAWGEVMRQIHFVGATGSPTLDPLAAETVANLGGWYHVSVSDTSITRKHFADAYRLAHARAEKARQERFLPAVLRRELERHRQGHPALPSRLSVVHELPPPDPDAEAKFEAIFAKLASQIGRPVDLESEEAAERAEGERVRAAQLAALEQWKQEQEAGEPA